MKKLIRLLPLFALLTLLLGGASEPLDPIRLTIINKSEMDIAVQLQAQPKVCCNKNETVQGEFYYLPVAEGTKDTPTTKTFIIERDTYRMQLYYIETWDPVYGFKCGAATPNVLVAGHNLKVVVLPCDQLPAACAVGEPTMWKYLPYPVPELSILFSQYWRNRLIY